ncbi:hypothetical protein GNP10_14630 [Escherichia coli]|nr:hypothetical protein [Escherichia coli]
MCGFGRADANVLSSEIVTAVVEAELLVISAMANSGGERERTASRTPDSVFRS